MLKLAAAVLALTTPIVIAAPAHAADVKTLRCVEDGLNAAARAALIKDMEKNLQNAGGEQGYSPETVSALQGAAKACQAKHGWSPVATESAMFYTVAKVTWPSAAAYGKSRGVNSDALARRVRGLTREQRADGTGQEVLTIVATGALEAKEIPEAEAMLGGALLGLVALQEKAYIDFENN